MPSWRTLFSRLRPKTYGRRDPLVLVNGLAEQHESWFRNRKFWSRYFDVYVPNFLVYDGPSIHQRIAQKQPLTVDYFVEQLHYFVTHFVQHAPYHFVASSLGGKIVVEFAARYPELVNRIVLLCPSGMGDVERLPIIDGVVRSNIQKVVSSVFYRPRFVDAEIVTYYKNSLANRKWKSGFLKTVRGTLEHSVRSRMPLVQAETLLVTGLKDQICDPKTAEEAAKDLPRGHFLALPKCGHAPQIERSWLINRLVTHFLTTDKPTAHPRWSQLLLAKPSKVQL